MARKSTKSAEIVPKTINFIQDGLTGYQAQERQKGGKK